MIKEGIKMVKEHLIGGLCLVRKKESTASGQKENEEYIGYWEELEAMKLFKQAAEALNARFALNLISSGSHNKIKEHTSFQGLEEMKRYDETSERGLVS